jgi:SAM-dependent methyltransferase
MTSISRPALSGERTRSKDRGERLHPSRSSRVYYVLSSLRSAIESVIGTYIAGSNIDTLVDFGCGNMPYRPLFAPHCRHYAGCDFRGNELADCIIDDIEHLPFETGSVQMVLSTQVLEHVADPNAYLTEARRILASDGLMVISTHGVWKFHPDPHDYWRWTADGLRLQLERAGFNVVCLKGIMGPAAAGLQHLQDATIGHRDGRFARIIIRAIQFTMSWLDRRCTDAIRDADASVYLLVAEPSATRGVDDGSSTAVPCK